jgi:ClpP class serine protease
MSYPLILQRCLNTPLLIEESKLEVLTSEVFLKLLANEPIDRTSTSPEDTEVSAPPNIAVIPVHGSLVNKNGAGASGVTSYERIRSKISAAIDAGVKVIGFDISSGGGEASGNFPLADLIHSLPERFGVQTFGFTDSIAASGGYSLLAATQKVYATDMATVGSIGAVATLADVTKMDDKMGVSYEIIRSRAGKQPYNPHEGISEKARSETLGMIKAWDNKFVTSLSKYRPQLSIETIDELSGGVTTAEKGIKLGLVDEIVSSIEDIFPQVQSNFGNGNRNNNKGIITMATQEETLAKLVDAQTELHSIKVSRELDIKQAEQTERARCLKILEAKKTFGVSETTAINAITKGFSLDMVTEMFTEIKAQMDENTAVITTTATQGSVTATTVADLQNLAQKQADPKDLGGGTYSMNDLLQGMADLATEQMGGA